MSELLLNPAVQTALITVIVIGLQILGAWLKKTFPTQAKLVEDNWCYLQPVVETAVAQAQARIATSAVVNPAVQDIVQKALAEFADSYRKLEGKDASTAELKAAATEISTAVARITGG